MKVSEVCRALEFTSYSDLQVLDREIRFGYTGDLLSCVMGGAPKDAVWITVSGHRNAVAVAVLREMACMILTEGNKPADGAAEKAAEEGIPILGTKMDSYETVCRLFQLGICAGSSEAAP